MIAVLWGVVGKLASATLCDLGAHDPRPAIVDRRVYGGDGRAPYPIGMRQEIGAVCSSCDAELPDAEVDVIAPRPEPAQPPLGTRYLMQCSVCDWFRYESRSDMLDARMNDHMQSFSGGHLVRVTPVESAG